MRAISDMNMSVDLIERFILLAEQMAADTDNTNQHTLGEMGNPAAVLAYHAGRRSIAQDLRAYLRALDKRGNDGKPVREARSP